VFWAVVVGNVATIVWLWWHGGNVTHVRSTGELLTSIARITGLLGAYLALLQVVLLSRLPWLERLVGFDKLAFWHRWNGHATLDIVLAHVFFSIWGYATLDKVSIPRSRGSTRFRPETSSSSTTQPRITGAPSTLRRSRC
jgi:predicted ferric reductase